METTIRNRQLPMITGVLLLLSGIYMLNAPLAAYTLLSKLFSILLVAGAVSDLVFYSRNRLPDRGLFRAGSLLMVILGLWLCLHPATSGFVLALYIAFQLIIRSVQGLVMAYGLNKMGAGRSGLLLVMSFGGMLLALLLAAQPMLAGMSLVLLIALSLIFSGLIGIVCGFLLKDKKGGGQNGKAGHHPTRDLAPGEYEVLEA